MVSLFWELSAARPSNGFAISRIPYLEILAWSKLTGIPLTPFEVQLVRGLDELYCAFVNRKNTNGGTNA